MQKQSFGVNFFHHSHHVEQLHAHNWWFFWVSDPKKKQTKQNKTNIIINKQVFNTYNLVGNAKDTKDEKSTFKKT